MNTHFRILILEDTEADAELIERELRKSRIAFTLKRVYTKSAYVDALANFVPDLVLSDHTLPQFNSIQALKLCKEQKRHTPFILVTGAVSEAYAVRCIQQGADDYILKSDLSRLSATIKNTFKQKQVEVEKNRAIEALRKSEEHFRTLIENSTDLVNILDSSHTITYSSPSIEKLLGYTPAEMNNKPIFSFIHPEDTHCVSNSLLKELVDPGLVQTAEFRFQHKDGSWRHLESVGKAYRDDLGNVNIIINSRDMTDRKRAEEKLIQQNIELEKINAELDHFVYSASHNLRAPLTSVLGLIKLSKMQKQGTEVDQYLHLMERSIDKLDGTVRDIINYSRNTRTGIQYERINFAATLNETLENLQYIDPSILIEQHITIDERLPFYSDKNRLSVIFTNLISNAVKYRNPYRDQSFIAITVEVTPEKAFITFNDNGIGIDAKQIGRIYDMFYRATDRSTGSGLGLYIVKETLNKLNATIRVDSSLDRGTTFDIEVPNMYQVQNAPPSHESIPCDR
ncbi:MAG: PAS domain S-box protein [Ferruginibacter sp.]|nr:PAS domain S-box protein [Cytophagales bacterium]